jgi:hypothetical protein
MGHSCLGDIVIDMAQNAANSGADLVELEIRENKVPGSACCFTFGFTIQDNGRGMDGEQLERVRRAAADYAKGVPLPRTAGGRGIPFMARAAEESGGSWELDSEAGRGTRVSARFGPADASALPPALSSALPPVLPVGDIPGTLRTALLFEGSSALPSALPPVSPGEVLIRRIRKDGTFYEIRKTELTRALGEPGKARTLILLDRYLRELEGSILGTPVKGAFKNPAGFAEAALTGFYGGFRNL